MLFAVPLGEFGGGGGFPLTVQPDQQQRRAAWLEGRCGTEDADKFRVEDVHGVRLDGASPGRGSSSRIRDSSRSTISFV